MITSKEPKPEPKPEPEPEPEDPKDPWKWGPLLPGGRP